MLSKLIHAFIVSMFLVSLTSCMNQDEKGNGEDDVAPDVSDYNKPELVMKPVTKDKPEGDTTTPDPPSEPPKEDLISKIKPEREGPDPVELENRRKVRGLFDQGVRKLKRNEYLASIRDFDQVLQIDPDNSRAYYNRGFAYYHLEMYSEAEADFDKSVELNPNDSSSFLYKGMIKYFKNNFEGAIEEYNKSIERAPQYSKAYYNRGLAKGRMQDLSGAINDFNKAIEIDPNNKEAYYNRALAYFMSGDTSTACTDWYKARNLGSLNAVEAIKYYCNDK